MTLEYSAGWSRPTKTTVADSICLSYRDKVRKANGAHNASQKPRARIALYSRLPDGGNCARHYRARCERRGSTGAGWSGVQCRWLLRLRRSNPANHARYVWFPLRAEILAGLANL